MTNLIKRLFFTIVSAFAVLFLAILFSFFKDLHFDRGFLYFEIFKDDQPVFFPNATPHLKYSITEEEPGRWLLRLDNKNFAYAYFYTYRNGKKDFELSDSIMFLVASRHIVPSSKDSLVDDSGFACGTGLSRIYLRPFESFTFRTDNIFSILHYSCLESYVDSTLNKYVHNDSLDIQLFLPAYAFGSEVQVFVSSNPFRISYKELKNEIYRIRQSFL